MSRVTSIPRVAGQDGSYLPERLPGGGRTVPGLDNRSSSIHTARIDRTKIHPRQSGADLNGIGLKLVVGRFRVSAAAIGARSGRSVAHA